MKQEGGGAGQIVAFYEMLLFQKILLRLLEDRIRQALTISCQAAAGMWVIWPPRPAARLRIPRDGFDSGRNCLRASR